jgi:hypothetical protein
MSIEITIVEFVTTASRQARKQMIYKILIKVEKGDI